MRKCPTFYPSGRPVWFWKEKMLDFTSLFFIWKYGIKFPACSLCSFGSQLKVFFKVTDWSYCLLIWPRCHKKSRRCAETILLAFIEHDSTVVHQLLSPLNFHKVLAINAAISSRKFGCFTLQEFWVEFITRCGFLKRKKQASHKADDIFCQSNFLTLLNDIRSLLLTTSLFLLLFLRMKALLSKTKKTTALKNLNQSLPSHFFPKFHTITVANFSNRIRSVFGGLSYAPNINTIFDLVGKMAWIYLSLSPSSSTSGLSWWQ